MLDRAAILMAFEQVGGADACLVMAKDYALNRYAFGRQIAFVPGDQAQARRHVRVERTRPLERLFRRLGALDERGRPARSRRRRAHQRHGRVPQRRSKENIQTHGGMGFTWELDCHLYYRRSKMLSLALGASRVWKDRLVNHLEKKNVA